MRFLAASDGERIVYDRALNRQVLASVDQRAVLPTAELTSN